MWCVLYTHDGSRGNVQLRSMLEREVWATWCLLQVLGVRCQLASGSLRMLYLCQLERAVYANCNERKPSVRLTS